MRNIASSWWKNLFASTLPNRRTRRANAARKRQDAAFVPESMQKRRLFAIDFVWVYEQSGVASTSENTSIIPGFTINGHHSTYTGNDTISFTLSGTATYGVDYKVYYGLNQEVTPVNGVFTHTVIDPGFDEPFEFRPICDGVTEGTETIIATVVEDGYELLETEGYSVGGIWSMELTDGSCTPPPPEIRIDTTDGEAHEASGNDATFIISKTSSGFATVELTFDGDAVPKYLVDGVSNEDADFEVYVNNETTPRTVSSTRKLSVSFSGPSFLLRISALGDSEVEGLEDVEVTITHVDPEHSIVEDTADATIADGVVTSFESILGSGCTCFACSCASANAKQDQATGQPLANTQTIAGQEFVYAGSAVALRNLAFQFVVPPELGAITKLVVGGQLGGGLGRTLDDVHYSGSVDPRGKTHYVNYQIPADEFAIGVHDAEIEVTYYFENGQTATHTQTLEYFNLDETNSEFGAGWRPRGYSRLHVESSGIFFDFADGNIAYFRETTPGVFKADPSPFINFSAQIVENLDGTYTYDDGHRNLQNFRADGYLLERVDRDGNVTEYVHSDLDSDSVAESLTSIVDPAGRAITFEYTSGKISKAIGIDGAESVFAHDSSGRLISVTEPDPTGSQTAPVTTFTYSGTSYKLASITDAEGHTVSYAYDANGYLSSISESGPSSETITTEYESYFSQMVPGSGQGTSTTPLDYKIDTATSSKKIDHDGKVTEYFYNRFGQATKVIHYDGTITVSTFSESGLLLESIDLDPDGTGPLTDRETTYTYDTNGNVTSITYADDSTETFTYDLDFNEVTSYTDQLGRLTLYSLDAANGRLTSVTRVMGEIDDSINLETDDAVIAFTYTVSSGGVKGLVETTTDAEGNVTKFVYDAYGRVDETIYAFGTTIEAREEFEYDAGDRITAYIDELGRRTEYVYDELGRLIQTIHPDLNGVTAYGVVSTFYEYNKLGWLTAVISPITQDPATGVVTSRKIETIYEDNFYRVKSRRPDHEGDSDTDPTDTKIQYDWLGRIDSTTDELGRVTDYIYDSQRRLQQIVSPDPTGSETSSVVSFTYDAWGRLKTKTDAVGNVTTYDYDSMHRVVKITHPDLGSGVHAEEEFIYDDAGQLIATIDPLDRKTTYAYDDFGRLISVTAPNPNGTDGTTPTILYSYDKNDNVVSEFQSNDYLDEEVGFLTTYEYDARNRLITITEPNPDPAHSSDLPVTQFGYDAAGQLEYTIDAEDRRTDFTYDAWGRLITTTLPDLDGPGGLARYTRQTAYDLLGRVISSTDALGYTTNYEYDKLDNLKLVTLPSVDGTAARTTRSFTYDAKSELKTETDERGAVTTYTYDELGRLTTVEQADPSTGAYHSTNSPTTLYEYYKDGRLKEVTDALGGKTTYAYDAMGRKKSETLPDPDGSSNPLERPVTEWAYDLAGRLTSVTTPDPDGSTGPKTAAVTAYAYDALGRLTAVTRPDPDTTDFVLNDTEYAYDRAGRLLTETDALGRVTKYDYDDRGRVTQVTRGFGGDDESASKYAYDEVGQLLSVKDPLNRETTYAYDTLGRRTSMTQPDPDGTGTGNPAPVTIYTYDAEGRLLTELAPGARAPLTQYEYDRLGRLMKRIDPDPDKIGTTSNGTLLSPETEYQYDAAGNLTKVIDPLDRETSYAYDYLGRRLTMTAPDPDAGTGTGKDPAVTSYQYDRLGRLTKVTAADPDGSGSKPAAVTDYAYDALGRRTKEELHDPDGTGPNGRPTTVYTYDAVGNLLYLTDPEGNVHGYAYDDLNRLETETDPLSATTEYEYDYLGNVTKKTDRRGLVTEYNYDDLNRRTAEIWKDGSSTVKTIAYAYDAASQLLSAEDDKSKVAYTYDALGRVVTVDNDGTDNVPRVVLTNLYNGLLLRSEAKATIDGTADFRTVYGYDTLGRVTSVVQVGQTGGNTVRAKNVLFYYDAASELKQLNRYDTADTSKLVNYTTYAFDGAGRTTAVSHSNYTVQDHRQHVYTYDTAGRETSHIKYGKTNNVALTPETIFSTYDATNQLTGTDYSTTQTDESYAYDENGNRVGTGVTVDDGNRNTNDGTFTYEYDEEGNRTERTQIATGNKLTYTWDHRNRLTSIGVYSSGGVLTKTVYYTYDAFDRRIAEDVDNGGNGSIDRVMTWVYDSEGKRDANGNSIDDVVLVFDGNGDLQRRYLHGFQADQILAEENVVTGEVTWPLADRMGTVYDRVVYDRTADRERFHSHVWYDSFGKIVKQVDAATGLVMATYDAKSYFGAFGPTYGFQGREFEADADLYYFRARWYDFRTAKFISEDPIFADTTNTYRFVGNGPTNGRDPSGLFDTWNDWWNIGLGLGQGGANVANGVQDVLIGGVNLNISAVNGIVWIEEKAYILDPNRSMYVPYIPSPDWSKNVAYEEGDSCHGWSKWIGGTSVELLATLGAGRVLSVGRTVGAGGLADDAASATGKAVGLIDDVAPVVTKPGGPSLPRVTPPEPVYGPELPPGYIASRPGLISGNPQNRRLISATPLKNGRDFALRWYRITQQDADRYINACVQRNRELHEETRWMIDNEAAVRYRFYQMQAFREAWLKDFLRTRTY